ncbi:hypothetical protein J3Q64DRAFT_1845613 [Phycomyces blakesleeanus]|uniref:Uncharacterized protein n=2 Tax=Phycomyces blakesleeanus TaxID=4837 RepID=A0A167PX80_PHYB8|nr:hypothetical protein PHYBLDRAFT_140755 [Phycomyces blakesleeanus NRRL 1555(-)]OAD78697.1 hypothetical protein PHYBLDRAFT_140755 [Phycomyces blakesleeanus NRRL 1555(-)]|eukprot:XP_018296737.1 hypothetical protein PHYBLDRAFT_140755 [Phycomyces blakesleeanus NRRL 1555(-)]
MNTTTPTNEVYKPYSAVPTASYSPLILSLVGVLILVTCIILNCSCICRRVTSKRINTNEPACGVLKQNISPNHVVLDIESTQTTPQSQATAPPSSSSGSSSYYVKNSDLSSSSTLNNATTVKNPVLMSQKLLHKPVSVPPFAKTPHEKVTRSPPLVSFAKSENSRNHRHDLRPNGYDRPHGPTTTYRNINTGNHSRAQHQLRQLPVSRH